MKCPLRFSRNQIETIRFEFLCCTQPRVVADMNYEYFGLWRLFSMGFYDGPSVHIC